MPTCLAAASVGRSRSRWGGIGNGCNFHLKSLQVLAPLYPIRRRSCASICLNSVGRWLMKAPYAVVALKKLTALVDALDRLPALDARSGLCRAV